MTTSIRYALLLTALLLFLGGPTLMRLYTDWLWFVEVGYEQVFLTMLRTQVALFVGAFVCAVAWLWLNLRQAVGSLGDVRAVFTTREGLEITVPGRRQLRALALGAAALLSILVGLFAAGQWETWLAWRHGMPFGEVDPLLGHEVRFYVFSLPFQQLLRGLLQTLVVVTGLATGGVYLLAGGMTSRFAGTLTLASGARRHLSLLGAVLFLLLAWGAWLQRAEYLVDASSPILHGASYADVHARMPAALVAMAVAVLGAGLALLHAFSQDRCLCARGGTRVCSKIDPECPNVLSDVPPPDDGDCVGDDCVSRIVIPTNYACECNAEAGWQCIAQI
jgi:uncharacterized membrane protein (UPF0182 family)